MSEMAPTLCSPREIAEMFGVSTRRINSLIREGALPVYVLGPRTRRIDVQAAREALALERP
ncbi:helix-turn-helix domain-containing protein [Micrococcus luteus]|nr:helix-turn-helix domain-containing protein [Micrococcus luteus]PLA45854.1 MerR family DNA-binding transcriptional regulator [Micrococcus luteus]